MSLTEPEQKIDTESSFKRYMENKDRVCTGCAYCNRFTDLSGNELMRCWKEPSVCDHPFVQSIIEAKEYGCENHRTPKEYESEKYEEAKNEYRSLKLQIARLLEKYPRLKENE